MEVIHPDVRRMLQKEMFRQGKVEVLRKFRSQMESAQTAEQRTALESQMKVELEALRRSTFSPDDATAVE